MIDRLRVSTRTQAAVAALAYLALSVAMTWPLARHLGRDVAWDLGDSVLNIWILAWDVGKFRSLLGGDLHALTTFFDANIFHPANAASTTLDSRSAATYPTGARRTAINTSV